MEEKHAIVSFVVVVSLISGALAVATPWRHGMGDEGATVTFTDMAGREVEVPENVDEIVGLEAGALRLITYLNATNKVVGVEQFEKDDQIGRPYVLAHPEFLNLPSIGPQHGGNAELITSQDPDLIFWTYTTAGDAEDLQKKAGIPVIALEYGDLGSNRDTFYEALGLMGDVLDKEGRASEIIQYTNSTIQNLENRTKNISDEEKPEAYVWGVSVITVLMESYPLNLSTHHSNLPMLKMSPMI